MFVLLECDSHDVKFYAAVGFGDPERTKLVYCVDGGCPSESKRKCSMDEWKYLKEDYIHHPHYKKGCNDPKFGTQGACYICTRSWRMCRKCYLSLGVYGKYKDESYCVHKR